MYNALQAIHRFSMTVSLTVLLGMLIASPSLSLDPFQRFIEEQTSIPLWRRISWKARDEAAQRLTVRVSFADAATRFNRIPAVTLHSCGAAAQKQHGESRTVSLVLWTKRKTKTDQTIFFFKSAMCTHRCVDLCLCLRARSISAKGFPWALMMLLLMMTMTTTISDTRFTFQHLNSYHAFSLKLGSTLPRNLNTTTKANPCKEKQIQRHIVRPIPM